MSKPAFSDGLIHDAEIVLPIHVAPIEVNGYLPPDIPPKALIVLRMRSSEDVLRPHVTEVGFARSILQARRAYPHAAIAVPIAGGAIVQVVHANDDWYEGQQLRQPGT